MDRLCQCHGVTGPIGRLGALPLQNCGTGLHGTEPSLWRLALHQLGFMAPHYRVCAGHFGLVFLAACAHANADAGGYGPVVGAQLYRGFVGWDCS